MTRSTLSLMIGLLACGGSPPPPASAQPTVTPSEDEDLAFLREEEKLARDVYLTLRDRWDIQAFTNISGAEQRHMDRIGALLSSRGIEDPITDNTVGVFTNPTLARLFTELTEAGEASEVAALRVGATIEDLDIQDILLMLGRTQDPEMTQTYELLLCGSRNHMRAFSGLLQERGETYTPQYISAEVYADILNGEHERCGRIYGGGGHGGGHGDMRGMRGGGHGDMRGGGHGGMRGGMGMQGGGMEMQGGDMGMQGSMNGMAWDAEPRSADLESLDDE